MQLEFSHFLDIKICLIIFLIPNANTFLAICMLVLKIMYHFKKYAADKQLILKITLVFSLITLLSKLIALKYIIVSLRFNSFNL